MSCHLHLNIWKRSIICSKTQLCWGESSPLLLHDSLEADYFIICRFASLFSFIIIKNMVMVGLGYGWLMVGLGHGWLIVGLGYGWVGLWLGWVYGWVMVGLGYGWVLVGFGYGWLMVGLGHGWLIVGLDYG